MNKNSILELITSNKFSDLLGVYNKIVSDNSFLEKNNFLNKKIRIAIIGSYTFTPLDKLIKVKGLLYNLNIEIFFGDFDNYHSEILSPKSDLLDFKPDFIFLFISQNKIKYMGEITDSKETIFQWVENEINIFSNLINVIHEKLKTEVYISNLIQDFEENYGVLTSSLPASNYNFIRFFNTKLLDICQSNTFILDLELVSSKLGLNKVFDYKNWYISKQIGSIDFQIAISNHISNILNNRTSPMEKVLILDLDNTIWGGVIGDDGIDGIEIGNTSPIGESFKDFQSYIKKLKDIGVLLAVCSKNESRNAKLPFIKHPEMILKLKDFVSFKANWEPKSENIKAIANDLNLGLDSMVFIDDNPAEIEQVNQFVPDVKTICLFDDPTQFKIKLKNSIFFEPRSITKEDKRKTELYRTEEKRKKLKNQSIDLTDYLKTLDMKLEIIEFRNIDVSRISQLINKSNQFNLTTIRRNENDIKEMINSKNFIGFSFRLIDKFSDHGLIGVYILEKQKKDLIIDTFIMSCRVLERQVENEIINSILNYADKNGFNRVIGRYIPTKKNIIVKDIYKKLSFKSLEKKSNSNINEFYLLTESYKFFNTQIKVSSINRK